MPSRYARSRWRCLLSSESIRRSCEIRAAWPTPISQPRRDWRWPRGQACHGGRRVRTSFRPHRVASFVGALRAQECVRCLSSPRHFKKQPTRQASSSRLRTAPYSLARSLVLKCAIESPSPFAIFFCLLAASLRLPPMAPQSQSLIESMCFTGGAWIEQRPCEQFAVRNVTFPSAPGRLPPRAAFGSFTQCGIMREIPKVALLIETARGLVATSCWELLVILGCTVRGASTSPPGDYEQVVPKMKQWGGTGIIARIPESESRRRFRVLMCRPSRSD